MCGGSGDVITDDTILTDIEGWLSRFKHSSDYRAVDLYVNPYMKTLINKGLFSKRWKWMSKLHIKITLVADESIPLSRFKVTLSGSDVDITDVVMRGDTIDEALDQVEIIEELDRGKDDLEITKKNTHRNSGNRTS